MVTIDTKQSNLTFRKLQDEEYLQRHIDARDYTSYMFVYDIFDKQEMEAIDATSGFFERNKLFLKTISEKGQLGYKVFRKGLKQRGFLSVELVQQHEEEAIKLQKVELEANVTSRRDRAWREFLDPHDEQQILMNFDLLVHEMDASCITKDLYSKHVLDSHDLVTIDSLRQPTRNEEFLRILCCRGTSAFTCFLEALQVKGYEKLYCTLVGIPFIQSSPFMVDEEKDEEDTESSDSSDTESSDTSDNSTQSGHLNQETTEITTNSVVHKPKETRDLDSTEATTSTNHDSSIGDYRNTEKTAGEQDIDNVPEPLSQLKSEGDAQNDGQPEKGDTEKQVTLQASQNHTNAPGEEKTPSDDKGNSDTDQTSVVPNNGMDHQYETVNGEETQKSEDVNQDSNKMNTGLDLDKGDLGNAEPATENSNAEDIQTKTDENSQEVMGGERQQDSNITQSQETKQETIPEYPKISNSMNTCIFQKDPENVNPPYHQNANNTQSSNIKYSSRKLSRQPINIQDAQKLRNTSDLLEQSLPVDKVVKRMTNSCILDEVDIETIQALEDNQQKVRELVSLVLWGGPKAYRHFVNTLRRVGNQGTLLRELNKGSNVRTPRRHVQQAKVALPCIVIDDLGGNIEADENTTGADVNQSDAETSEQNDSKKHIFKFSSQE